MYRLLEQERRSKGGEKDDEDETDWRFVFFFVLFMQIPSVLGKIRKSSRLAW